jgi:hypothetical protein
MSLPLFEALEPEPVRAPRAGGVTRADLVEQIRRDLEALHDPIEWMPGREFYRARIAACREWSKAFAFTQTQGKIP